MRAKFINEEIGFKREGDVKGSLQIGAYTIVDNYFKDLIEERITGDPPPFISWGIFRNIMEDNPEFLEIHSKFPLIVDNILFKNFIEEIEATYESIDIPVAPYTKKPHLIQNSEIFEVIKWTKNAFPDDLSKAEGVLSIARKLWDKEISKLITKKAKNRVSTDKYPEIVEAEEYLKSQGLKILTTNAQNKNGSISVLHPDIPTEYVITGGSNVLRYPTRTYGNRGSLVFQTAPGDYMAKAIGLAKRLNRLAKKYTKI